MIFEHFIHLCFRCFPKKYKFVILELLVRFPQLGKSLSVVQFMCMIRSDCHCFVSISWFRKDCTAKIRLPHAGQAFTLITEN